MVKSVRELRDDVQRRYEDEVQELCRADIARPTLDEYPFNVRQAYTRYMDALVEKVSHLGSLATELDWLVHDLEKLDAP
jgi:hypothetical protein